MADENEVKQNIPDKKSVWDPKSGTLVKEGTSAPIENAGDSTSVGGKNDIDNPEGSAKEAEAGNWKLTESPQGTIAPIEKAGKVEEPVMDSNQLRWAKQGTPDFEGTKADVEPETLDTGKKVRGHKTKSGL